VIKVRIGDGFFTLVCCEPCSAKRLPLCGSLSNRGQRDDLEWRSGSQANRLTHIGRAFRPRWAVSRPVVWVGPWAEGRKNRSRVANRAQRGASSAAMNEKTPRRFERGALTASGPRSAVYAALAANFPRSVFTNRASFPFSLISRRIAL
jgi:hypothetical protein